MISFPIDLELPHDTVMKLHSTRNWAIQTLLEAQKTQSHNFRELILQPHMLSNSLRQMQTKLFKSAPCRPIDVQIEIYQSLLAAVRIADEKSKLSDVMEMCASMLHIDEYFLQFAESALNGRLKILSFGPTFLQRLFSRSFMQLQVDEGTMVQKIRLFDALSLESQACVWANHLPSWWSHLQKWMLEAHRTPFNSISAIVLPINRMFRGSASQSETPTLCQYSQLYVTFVEWCRDHVDLLSSCRSMEVINALSQSTRPQNAAELFNRQLLTQLPPMNRSRGWSQSQRKSVFVTIGSALKRLQATCSTSDIMWQYEWIGILERPYLLHEALEAMFNGELSSKEIDRKAGDNLAVEHCAAIFFGWFYSFTRIETVDKITALVTTVSSKLKVSSILNGALWLNQNRAKFGCLPLLRLRLVWFWLLQSIDTELSAQSENRSMAAETDVLESIEYIFRRFTPVATKQAFQSEFVVQLLVELEWRAANANTKTIDSFLRRIAPLCAWLTKVVRLMQHENQATHDKDSRNRGSNHRNATSDVQHVIERLAQFSIK